MSQRINKLLYPTKNTYTATNSKILQPVNDLKNFILNIAKILEYYIQAVIK
jgi:hypothetical protein